MKGHEVDFIPFLFNKWMSMLQYTMQEAKRLNMGIDLANGTGWPFGGPLVTPEDACKEMFTKVYSLKEGEMLNEKVQFEQQPFYRSESRRKVNMDT